jgi:hypothetical protein
VWSLSFISQPVFLTIFMECCNFDMQFYQTHLMFLPYKTFSPCCSHHDSHKGSPDQGENHPLKTRKSQTHLTNHPPHPIKQGHRPRATPPCSRGQHPRVNVRLARGSPLTHGPSSASPDRGINCLCHGGLGVAGSSLSGDYE